MNPEKIKKLETFVEKATSGKMVNFWSNPDELATKLSLALIKSFITHPRIGWVKLDKAISPKVAEELAGLSKENRELKAELDELKKQEEKAKPLLELNFNGNKPLELAFKKQSNNYIFTPSRIEDIPEHLKEYIDHEKIREYNDGIEDEIELVKEYNSNLEMYNNIINLAVPFDLSLSNVGKAKANNVYLEIKFPSEIEVIEGKKEGFSEPKRPTLSKNPLKEAERNYKRAQQSEGSVDSLLRFMERVGGSSYISGYNPGWDINPDIFKTIVPSRRDGFYSTLNDDNSITIYRKELLHTRRSNCPDDYILVPKKAGEYEIIISIICEEYLSKEVISIPVTIRDKE
ncbi:hypothetical protein [Bacillus sp. FJAT-45066]|uniref:hypothetical protein n=1 Tax=Bacillus sp. FJAT-45066 TaxID=2011010 RepID=UPI0011432113|nr:hypothetical protein [Bacillus sp. FJAT-45066]